MNNTKTQKFIRSFITLASEFNNVMNTAFSRESFHAKMLRLGGHNPQEIYRGTRNLERRKLLKLTKQGYLLSSRGKMWLADKRIETLTITPTRWDRKWRLVIFDIPEAKRRERKILIRKLKSLGFYLLQRSVYVLPFACQEVIGDLAGYLGVSDYVEILTTDSVGFSEEAIKSFFGLK